MLAASAGAIAYSAYKCKDDLDEKKIPLMGVMGAVIFAGQMINFTIPGTGSSGPAWPSGHCPRCCWLCPPAISSPRPLPGSGATFPRQPAPSALRYRRGAAGTAGGPVL